MKRSEIIGIITLCIGIIYAGFWTVAKAEDNRLLKIAGHEDVTKDIFLREFPALNVACHFFGFEPFGKPTGAAQSPWSGVHNGIVRHIWLGLSLLFLGSSLVTFGGSTRLRTGLHYVCVMSFGGVLFIAVWLHPMIMSYRCVK